MMLLCAGTAGTARAATCSFSLETGLTFAAYDVFSPTDVTTTGQMRFSCDSDDVPVTVDLDGGIAGTFDPRTMIGPASDALAYNIYLDPGHSQVWGDATGGTAHYSATTAGAGAPVLLSYYGVLFARQDVAAGAYADTVEATLDL